MSVLHLWWLYILSSQLSVCLSLLGARTPYLLLLFSWCYPVTQQPSRFKPYTFLDPFINTFMGIRGHQYMYVHISIKPFQEEVKTRAEIYDHQRVRKLSMSERRVPTLLIRGILTQLLVYKTRAKVICFALLHTRDLVRMFLIELVIMLKIGLNSNLSRINEPSRSRRCLCWKSKRISEVTIQWHILKTSCKLIELYLVGCISG